MAGIAETGSVLYGPVELNLIALSGSQPSEALLEALAVQVRAGVLRLLDLVVIHKGEGGDVDVHEIDLSAHAVNNPELALAVPGLTGDDDLKLLADDLEPGASAAVVAFELLYARDLAAQLAADGCAVVTTERIPAPVVNALVEMADDL